MSASNATTTCAVNTVLPIPGDCTVAQHRALQDDVTAKCKGDKRTCKGINDCITLLENMQKNWACAEARETVAVTCFRGGDAGHKTAITEALNAAAYCERQYNSKCKPQQQPQPAPQPQPTPVEDKKFMEKMAAITGLSGTALVLYLIISEGSRLFPPRNLIPVP